MGTNLKSRCERVASELQAHVQEKKKSKNKQVQPIIPPIMELPSEQVSTFVAINGTHSHPQGTTTEGSVQTRRSARVHNAAVHMASPAPKDATDFDGGEYASEPETDSGDEVTPTARNKGKGRPSGNRCLLDPRDPGNFLKLVSVLNIFLADSLTDAEIDKADTLIREYNVELIEVSQALVAFALYRANHNLALWPRGYQAEPPLFNTYP